MFLIEENILEVSFQGFYKDKPSKLCVILTKILSLWVQTEMYGLLWEFVATQGRNTYYYFHLGTGLGV